MTSRRQMAEIQLRRLRLHLIPLELRTPSPCPITLVSLQGRLPNLHRLRSSAIHNDSWMLRTRRLTGWRIHSPSVMPNTLWLWVFGLCPRNDFSLSNALRWVALKRQKSCTNSEQPPIYGVGGGLFIATRQPDLICPKWPWVTKEPTCVQRSDFKHTRQLT